MGKTNEVELNKEMFTDSNGKTYPLSDLEKYDFSNDWGWKCEGYCKITDIYKKTFFDLAISLSEDLQEKYVKSEKEYTDLIKPKKEDVDFIGIGKGYAEYCQRLLRKDERSRTDKTNPNRVLKLPDPDSESLLLQKIYNKLWEDKYLEGCKVSKKIKGETMNSIWTSLNKAYEFIEPSEQREWRKKQEQDIKKIYLLCRYAESMLNGEFVSNLDKIRGLRPFLESAHRLGNFIPVPEGCNQPRGSYFGELRDYWDLTLLIIYNYYTGKKDDIRKIVEKVSVNEGENKEEKIEELTKRYKEWLDSFGNWDNFVRKNYMRAFVNIKEYGKEKYDENEHYDMPRELWDGHFKAFSERGVALPEDTKQAEQFFERTSFCIHERSVDMIDELKKRL